MVWFQCEDCGENLKKPKLANHFRICYASKLSCIDCGETFGQQNVQGHNQCITEAEKYGPKGQGKASNAKLKPGNHSKQKPEVDINVGLSERPPWFCSLCNTNATSRQTLLLHAEGKKHRAKARAYHAANQTPKVAEESAPSALSNGNTAAPELPSSNGAGESKEQDPPKVPPSTMSSEGENISSSKKKRKLEVSVNGGTVKNTEVHVSGELGYGEVIQVETIEADQVKKAKMCESRDDKRKLKLTKLITSVLKSTPEGVLKVKKLRKHVLKALQESGVDEDENILPEKIEHKINSSTKFKVENKYVSLVVKP
ncbi:Zinc finger, C2H2, LYAR-type [Dillenia turbinata]|uniref:Zinc finger, C2H2, LYAR-type n=1 Tax=Dillenia turbinata TaxID=194707 RepID=A0AAN8VUP5_9MAGN